ncbi:MAG: ABC transporter permease, partial [Clostridia bacterium]|nr:ABC transporter permease [Clostridia bacterium]
MELDKIARDMLVTIADLHKVPEGAYNLRLNGKGVDRKSSANIDIVPKKDKPGIDIIIKPGTKNESVHIPVLLMEIGLSDMVYNDFFVGSNADVTIIAGCG